MPNPISIELPSQIATTQYLRGGVYGNTGAGKTTLLASCGHMVKRMVERGEWPEGKPYMWVVSAYPENIKPFLPFEPYIVVSRLTEWAQLDQVLKFLQSNLTLPGGAARPEMQQPGAFFRAVCFDTWTRFFLFALRQEVKFVMPEPGQEAAFIAQAAKSPQGFAAWQNVGSLSSLWMEFFCKLPLHTMFTFQEETREPKFEHDPLTTGPALSPYAVRGVKESLEMIGRLFVQDANANGLTGTSDPTMRQINLKADIRHYMLVGQHDRYVAKGPTHALGYVLEAPTWEKLERSVFAPPPTDVEEKPKEALSPTL